MYHKRQTGKKDSEEIREDLRDSCTKAKGREFQEAVLVVLITAKFEKGEYQISSKAKLYIKRVDSGNKM